MRFLLPPEPDGADWWTSAYAGVDRTPRRSATWVLANMVAGLDGTAAAEGRVASLSGPRDHELFLRLRDLADVVLVGAETVRRERYGPVRPSPGSTPGPGFEPARLAVVSASLDLSPDLPLFAEADRARPPLVFTTAATAATATTASTAAGAAGRRALPAEVVVAGEVQVDPALVLRELGGRGLSTVLCEGGPTLLGTLLEADLLDEYCLTVSPVVGGDPLPVVNTTAMSALRHFRLAHVLEEDGALFLRYETAPPYGGTA